METTLQKTVRNSEVAVSKDKREFLTYVKPGLVSCTLETTEDSIKFIFDTIYLTPANTILKKPKWEQLRFLANCAALENLSDEYDFSLSMDNLMIDMNLIPSILIRDAKKSENIDFRERYMALIASVLLPKHKYEDYINGGQSNYKKSKLLTELALLDTTEAMQDRLFEVYQQRIHEIETTQKLVLKKNVFASRIAIPALVILLAAVTFFGTRMWLFDIPFRDSVITANTAYIHGDFLRAQEALRNYDVHELSVDTRFFLSRAYVSTEALTEAQRENRLITLAQRTEPLIFDFWILLGRLRFAEAVDIAQRLGDNELLEFAYIKQEGFVRQDMSLSGEERTELLTYLVNHINRLGRERDEAIAAMDN